MGVSVGGRDGCWCAFGLAGVSFGTVTSHARRVGVLARCSPMLRWGRRRASQRRTRGDPKSRGQARCQKNQRALACRGGVYRLLLARALAGGVRACAGCAPVRWLCMGADGGALEWFMVLVLQKHRVSTGSPCGCVGHTLMVFMDCACQLWCASPRCAAGREKSAGKAALWGWRRRGVSAMPAPKPLSCRVA